MNGMNGNGAFFWLILLAIVILIVLLIWWIFTMGTGSGDPLYTAVLNQAGETPPTGVPGEGFVTLNLANSLNSATYSLEARGFNSPVTAAHFHLNAASGQIVKNINISCAAVGTTGNVCTARGVWTSTDATQPLTPDIVNALTNQNLWVNIHTQQNPTGAIAGRLLLVK